MLQVIMLRPIKKGFVLSICLAIVLVSVINKNDFAVEIVPATARDILNALGPDARGLNLPQDALPDLFALTASRIEEHPKKFIVQELYESGRWKGGRAVIEYARDLSYTLVSVYDKDGHRQRIYSVRTNYTEHIARQESLAQVPDLEQTPEQPEAKPREVARETPKPTPTRSSPSTPTSTPVSMPINTAENPTASNGGYEWDEAQGTYVPVPGSSSLPATEPATAIAAKPAASENEESPKKS